MKKSVSIIVITRNSERTLSGCLESLENQSYSRDQYEIIVVDGASTDATVKICKEHKVKLVELEVWGIPIQRNIGIINSSGEYIAFLDSDDIACETWIQDSINYLRSHEKENVAAVGCSHALSNNKKDFIRLAWLEHIFRHSRLSAEVNHLGTSGAVFKKSVIGEVGGFDTKLLAAEDMDLSSRIVKAGYKIHLLKVQLIKVEYADSLAKYLKKQIFNVAYMVLFYMKPKSVRSRKGSYSNYREHIQGILPLLFLFSCIILRNYGVLIALGTWLIALVALNRPFLAFAFRQQKTSGLSKSWILTAIPYFFLRSIAWCAGLIDGAYMVGKAFIAVRSGKSETASESGFRN